jgi:hypothetical protein
MDGLGNQTFAGSGLTGDKNRTVAVGYFFNQMENLLHFMAATNNRMISIFITQICQRKGIVYKNIRLFGNAFGEGCVLHILLLFSDLTNMTWRSLKRRVLKWLSILG